MTTDAHLFLLVHGLWGGAGHLKSIEGIIKQNVVDSKEEISILRPKTSSLFKTYDGIEIIGQRMMLEIFEELKRLADDGKNVKKISIIGYSLGGLVARYIIGELEKMTIFNHIEPQYFATFATPHLGVWYFKKSFHFVNILGSNILGLVGSELFIKDKDKILLRLTEGDYINGLKKFKKRFCFANIRHDRTVNFYTSFITNKNPFDEHWDELDISFDFEEDNVIPKYKIRGVEVSPKIVDFKKSTFRGKDNKKPNPSIYEKLKYAGVLLLLSIILPIWIPFVFTASSIGSVISYIIVKTYKRPTVPELKDFLSINSPSLQNEIGSTYLKNEDDEGQDDEGNSVSLRERIDEATGEAFENVINITQYDSLTESSRARDRTESEQLYNTEEEENLLQETLNTLYRDSDTLFKNPKVDDYELFQKSTALQLDEDRMKIHDKLNELDWFKFAVYVNVLNAHDGIVARKGLERSTVKGIATISVFSHLINEDIKSLNEKE